MDKASCWWNGIVWKQSSSLRITGKHQRDVPQTNFRCTECYFCSLKCSKREGGWSQLLKGDLSFQSDSNSRKAEPHWRIAFLSLWLPFAWVYPLTDTVPTMWQKYQKRGSCLFKCHHTKTAALKDTFHYFSSDEEFTQLNGSFWVWHPNCDEHIRAYVQGSYSACQDGYFTSIMDVWDPQEEPRVSFSVHISCRCPTGGFQDDLDECCNHRNHPDWTRKDDICRVCCVSCCC